LYNVITIINFHIWKFKVLILTYNKKTFNNKIYWINPDSIKYVSNKIYSVSKYNNYEIIESGNWDNLIKKVTKSSEYNLINNNINIFKFFKNMENYDDFIDVLNKYNDLKEKSITFEDEININIGRHGDLLLNDGIYRLILSQFSNINKIPVKIIARHSDWKKFKNELEQLSDEKKLYQSLTHMDLTNIKAEHQCYDRYELIANNLTHIKGNLLDIGANSGYYCNKFEKLGFECYAVENNVKALYYLNKIKRSENYHYHIIPKNILEWDELNSIKFDVVLALNVFHHFLKSKENYYKFKILLSKLNMKNMFFEPHIFNEPQMKGAYKNYNPEEFVSFILLNSKLENSKFIGKAHDGRSLYKLY